MLFAFALSWLQIIVLIVMLLTLFAGHIAAVIVLVFLLRKK